PLRQEDRRPAAEQPGRVRHRGAVVAGAGRDDLLDPAPRQADRERPDGPARLERPGREVGLQLEPHRAPGPPRQRGRLDQAGRRPVTADQLVGRPDRGRVGVRDRPGRLPRAAHAGPAAPATRPEAWPGIRTRRARDTGFTCRTLAERRGSGEAGGTGPGLDAPPRRMLRTSQTAGPAPPFTATPGEPPCASTRTHGPRSRRSPAARPTPARSR